MSCSHFKSRIPSHDAKLLDKLPALVELGCLLASVKEKKNDTILCNWQFSNRILTDIRLYLGLLGPWTWVPNIYSMLGANWAGHIRWAARAKSAPSGVLFLFTTLLPEKRKKWGAPLIRAVCSPKLLRPIKARREDDSRRRREKEHSRASRRQHRKEEASCIVLLPRTAHAADRQILTWRVSDIAIMITAAARLSASDVWPWFFLCNEGMW